MEELGRGISTVRLFHLHSCRLISHAAILDQIRDDWAFVIDPDVRFTRGIICGVYLILIS